jgi:hypothetical protein
MASDKSSIRRGKLPLEKAIVCKGRLQFYVWEWKARMKKQKSS